MDKQQAFEIVYEELSKHPMYTGKYDTRHAKPNFMYGIASVMEHIAFKAGKLEEYTELYFKNYEKSLEKWGRKE